MSKAFCGLLTNTSVQRTSTRKAGKREGLQASLIGRALRVDTSIRTTVYGKEEVVVTVHAIDRQSYSNRHTDQGKIVATYPLVKITRDQWALSSPDITVTPTSDVQYFLFEGAPPLVKI